MCNERHFLMADQILKGDVKLSLFHSVYKSSTVEILPTILLDKRWNFSCKFFFFQQGKRSLQSAGIQQVTKILTSRVGSAGIDEDKQVYKGLLAVWNQLILLNEENGMVSVKSYILFNEGLELFLGYFKSYIPGTKLREYRSKFRDALMNKNYGLRVNLIYVDTDIQYIVLRPDSCDLESFYSELIGVKRENHVERVNLSVDFLRGVISTIDSEWDKICLKVVISASRSRREIKELGMDPDTIPRLAEKVIEVIQERKRAELAGADIVNLRIRKKEETLESEVERHQNKLLFWSKERLDELEDRIALMKDALNDLKKLRKPETKYEKQKIQQMIMRQVNHLLEINRVKRRQTTNQGPQQRIDSELEEFVAKSMEDKATYHGRRHDTVMYVNQRVETGLAKHCKLQITTAW